VGVADDVADTLAAGAEAAAACAATVNDDEPAGGCVEEGADDEPAGGCVEGGAAAASTPTCGGQKNHVVRGGGTPTGDVERNEIVVEFANGSQAPAEVVGTEASYDIAVLRIDPKVEIRSDAVASIVMAGLIGTNYIGIDLGSPTAAALKDGAEIRTKVTPDINAIMTELGNLGQKLEGALGSLTTTVSGDGKNPGLFQKLDRLVTDNSTKIDTTMTNLASATDKINKGEGTLGKLLNDSKLHDELVATVSEIKAAASDAKFFVADAQILVNQVKSGKGTLGALIFDETAGNDLKIVTRNLRDISEKIAKGEGTLGKLLTDDSLYLSAQSTLKKADRAIDSLGDSGPITAVGAAANVLF
jgi:phospholipid/cholesterol/gamma-HCH transport system substrate-binding protein